ncbi:MAG: hypothetical protein ABIP51_18250 [Bacteroidia bacterium]
MAIEKRSVHTDALETLGKMIDDTAERDAIHLAVEPCIAGEILTAGEHIGIVNGLATKKTEKKLGIVDPFLNEVVVKGERFWLIVYPRTITSLRHVWAHPDFGEGNSVSKTEAEEWLRNFQEVHDCPPVEIMIDKVKNEGVNLDEYFHFSGYDAHGSIPDEFWEKMEIVTDIKIKNPPKHFSCSC